MWQRPFCKLLKKCLADCHLSVFIVVLTCSILLQGVHSLSVEQDLLLSKDEKLALDKVSVFSTSSHIQHDGTEVIHILPEAYMREDIYLIRWLRAKNFSIADAKAMLFENLKWRKVNNMSTIHQEDWSDMQEDYPYFVDTIDKEGRPIATLRFGEWDIRQAVLTSRGPRLTRYLYKALDEVTGKVRALQKQGKLVTQWVSLLDMDGYSLATHGCIQCIGIYLSYVTAYETYFPGSVHNIILINTPTFFEAVLRITRPLLRESTKSVLRVFGTNRRQWQTYLLQNVDPNQLEHHFGGRKIRP